MASSAVVVSYDMSGRVSLLSAMGCTASLPPDQWQAEREW